MEKLDLADNIREDICEELLVINQNLGKIPVSLARKIISDVDNHISLINRFNVGNNIVIFRNTSSNIIKQMYTDYYRIIRYKEKQNDIEDDNEILKLDIDKINLAYYNPFLFPHIIASMLQTYLMTNLDKIIINRSLNKNDIKYLNSINPYFENEFDLYNKKIDFNFIANQLDDIMGMVEPNKEYYYIANALFALYKIDKKEVEEIITNLFSNVSLIIQDYNLKEDSIKIGKYNLTRRDLEFLLKDYFEHEDIKKLRYKKGDNNENE